VLDFLGGDGDCPDPPDPSLDDEYIDTSVHDDDEPPEDDEEFWD